MHCPKCGIANRDGRKFCASCGAPLATECPKCGAANLPGEFCGECGAPLSAPVDRCNRTRRGPRGRRGVAACDDPVLRPGRFGHAGGATRSRGMARRWQAISVRRQRRSGALGARWCATSGRRHHGVLGYPAAHDNDAERAVRAGLAILDAIAQLNQRPGHRRTSRARRIECSFRIL